ncbi:MAG: FAD-dependent oxidoreductase [Chlamydiota bacterium]|jgi:thioredoxin reductase (NADPH)
MLRIFCIILTFFSFAAHTAEKQDVLILGGGVGGVSAAIYLARAGYKPIVIEGKNPGGLISQSHLVQNWPGEKEIAGYDLFIKLKEQAEACGAVFYSESVKSVDFSKRPFQIITTSTSKEDTEKKYLANSCIIAMGTTPNFLNVEGEKTYWGKGITNCAVCDGPLYIGKTVGIVGGSDSALTEAEYLSKLAKKVYIFVRKDKFRTVEKERESSVLAKDNVEVLFNTEVKKIVGDDARLQKVVVQDHGALKEVQLDGLFLSIGSKPNTKIFQNQLKLDEIGYIALRPQEYQQTSVEGVYAVGDIVDPVFKQAITAAGDGARAALKVKGFLAEKNRQL